MADSFFIQKARRRTGMLFAFNSFWRVQSQQCLHEGDVVGEITFERLKQLLSTALILGVLGDEPEDALQY